MSGKRVQNSEQPTVAYFPPAQQAPSVAEAPTEIWVRAPQAPRRPNWLLRIVGIVAVMVFAVLSAALLGGGLLIYESEWIVPGVTVLGMDVGGQTTAEATTALANSWQNRQVTLVAGAASWAVSPDELGMTLDAQATAVSAHQQGRSWQSLKQGWQQGGFAISPVWQIDMSVAEAKLTALAPELTTQPVNASMVWADGRFQAAPAVPGQTLDVAATLTALQGSAAMVVMNGRFDLITQSIAPAINDVSVAVAQANALLDTPLAVRAYDPITDETWTWQVAPAVWGQWLTVDMVAAQDGQLQWSVDAAQAGVYVNGQVAMLGDGRFIDETAAADAVVAGIDGTSKTLRIYHQPQQHTVQSGETIASIGRDYGVPYPWIQQANPGVDSLFAGQVLTIPSLDELVPLPVVENKRIIVSITEQRVWVYENGSLKWEWAASTGIDDSPTSPGIFQIQSHEANAYAGNWDLWMPSFMGIYQPVPTSEFMNGFHGFPTRGGSQLLWTGNLGQKVTYGCILVSSDNAQTLYNWAEEGVVVEIRP
ncbi:MAG: L,D-transpeptidase family protein [Ardenticatenaceae bacterium]|nr:L,D-transpeptidase family protein [Anaerolineales bacterium]MCB8922920.1 L,D-transpeptidase family protein [Ardenticatenaceae bacterium]MCB8990344.1 L,D-transpeptidase family protein [Ardenticatenaceae bacterium]MCB9005237.1 L,D-transpeptidase family protein [Ardenticatenaceae bacterium]